MPYYDPSQWIASDDRLISHIEEKVKADKSARSRSRTRGQSFLPRNSLELEVVDINTREVMRLTESMDKLGRVRISLTDAGQPVRNGHFNATDYHHNPDGTNIRPPHHSHFPTEKYPDLTKHHTYAHPLRLGTDDADFLTALQTFCENTNTQLSGVTLPLFLRGN